MYDQRSRSSLSTGCDCESSRSLRDAAARHAPHEASMRTPSSVAGTLDSLCSFFGAVRPRKVTTGSIGGGGAYGGGGGAGGAAVANSVGAASIESGSSETLVASSDMTAGSLKGFELVLCARTRNYAVARALLRAATPQTGGRAIL